MCVCVCAGARALPTVNTSKYITVRGASFTFSLLVFLYEQSPITPGEKRKSMVNINDDLLGSLSEQVCNQGRYEDVEVGICLHKVGVASHNSHDRFGRDTLHPLRPSIHIAGPIPSVQLEQDRFAMVSVSIIHRAGPSLRGQCTSEEQKKAGSWPQI